MEAAEGGDGTDLCGGREGGGDWRGEIDRGGDAEEGEECGGGGEDDEEFERVGAHVYGGV